MGNSPGDRESRSLMQAREPGLVMIGDFPPPVHGMSAVNQAMAEHMASRGAPPRIINIASAYLGFGFWARQTRLLAALWGALKFIVLIMSGRCRKVYMSVSGGYGQLYDIIYITVSRLRRTKLFIHHHSFAYLNNPNAITRLLCRLAGPHSYHVVLCETMGIELINAYPSVERIFILSNSAVIPFDEYDTVTNRRELKTIGFLGNITRSKGIMDFLEVVSELKKQRIPINALIAGPFAEKDTRVEVTGFLQQTSSVQYVGSKYGHDKRDFLRSIDVLIFPTRYKHEAEPLTSYEAFGASIPVIAYGRGCIPDIITHEVGLVIDQNEAFVYTAVKQLLAWYANPAIFQTVSAAARERFLLLRRTHQERLEQLYQMLTEQ